MLRRRVVRVEQLERRDLLAVTESGVFELSEVLDGAGLTGELTAEIDWGDGSQSEGSISRDEVSSLTARIDYSLDTNSFFAIPEHQDRRDLLEQAVDMVLGHFGDDLAAIEADGTNLWTALFNHPATGLSHNIAGPAIDANEIVIFAGGREHGGTLGSGAPGGFEVNGCLPGSSFCDDVATRGESGAAGENPMDVGPWGGSVSFDITTNWHFGETTEGLSNDEADFLSVAVHEVAHLLGFGTADSWETFREGNRFTGPETSALFGGDVPLIGGAHWSSQLAYQGPEPAMDPKLTNGDRKLLADLDLAALDDIGWERIDPSITVTGDHTYSADGDYTVTVAVEDEHGTSRTATVEVTASLSPPSWHNDDNPFDVNADGFVVPEDVLLIIDDLNIRGSRRLPPATAATAPPHLDVSNDGFVAADDVLKIINFLNGSSRAAEAEAPSRDVGLDALRLARQFSNETTLAAKHAAQPALTGSIAAELPDVPRGERLPFSIVSIVLRSRRQEKDVDTQRTDKNTGILGSWLEAQPCQWHTAFNS